MEISKQNLLKVDQELSVRLMLDDKRDYERMLTWLTNPNLSKYYGNGELDTIEQIIAKYRIRTTENYPIRSCFILFQEEPIGYIQFYPIENKDKIKYGFLTQEIIYGIDLFIADLYNQNKGFGTKILTGIVRYIKESFHPNHIVIDPRSDNKRAIHCYEKCGFRFKCIFPKEQLYDGIYYDTFLMEQ